MQSELVDHLANAIESEWQENPNLTFDEALNKEFQKFGVFGFMGVEEEKQKFLGTRYRKLIWKYYKEFFRLPKIILTFMLIYSVYLSINFFENPKRIFFICCAFGLLISWFYMYKMKRKKEQKSLQTDKKWLFEETTNNVNNISLWVIPSLIFNLFGLISIDENWQNWYSFPASFFLVFIGLFYYISLKIIPKKVTEELAKTYPEYKFENL